LRVASGSAARRKGGRYGRSGYTIEFCVGAYRTNQPWGRLDLCQT
jgi:hypothetical protein